MPTPKPKTPTKDKNRFIEAIGRRKSAIARVRIYPSTNKRLVPEDKLDVVINDKEIAAYFPKEHLYQTAVAPFSALNVAFKISAKVCGGGEVAQAEAVRLGLARALNKLNDKWHTPLKTAGFLRRDPRTVERKKPGLRKARRPQQWRKR